MALLKVTCQRPRDRENDILKVIYNVLSFMVLFEVRVRINLGVNNVFKDGPTQRV